jgi:TonB family protein
MRGEVIGSTLVHASLLAALFAVPHATTMVVPGPDVVQVALIEPSATPAMIAPPPPTPEPEKTLEPIKPTEDSGVKLAPPKPEKKKKKPEKSEEPAPREPAPALPYAPAGPQGLQGQIAVDASDFEFTYYLLLVRNRIAQNWTPPAGLVTSGRPVHAVVYFRIARTGDLSEIRLESGSAVEFFDRSALRSVQISAPLPPLPLGYSGYDLGVHFGFEYSGP